MYSVKFNYRGVLVADPIQKSLAHAKRKAERLNGAVFDLKGNLVHMPESTVRHCLRSLGRPEQFWS